MRGKPLTYTQPALGFATPISQIIGQSFPTFIASLGLIASAFTGVMPISALVLSYVLLGEPFRWIHVLGFAVVVASIVVMAYANEREPAGTPG